MDLLDAFDGEDVAGRLAGEFVGAMAGADRDGKRIELRALDESDGLIRIGELVVFAGVDDQRGAIWTEE